MGISMKGELGFELWWRAKSFSSTICSLLLRREIISSATMVIRNSITSPDKITYKKVNVYYRNVSVIGKVGPIRAQITSDVEVPPPAKVEKESKKMEEGVIVNKYKPKNPYTGRCLLNTKITGDDALGETNHMVFAHDRMLICAGLRGSTQFNGDFQSNNPNNKFL